MARPKLDLEKIKMELPTMNVYLENQYGKRGTPEREEFSKKALSFGFDVFIGATNINRTPQKTVGAHGYEFS